MCMYLQQVENQVKTYMVLIMRIKTLYIDADNLRVRVALGESVEKSPPLYKFLYFLYKLFWSTL